MCSIKDDKHPHVKEHHIKLHHNWATRTQSIATHLQQTLLTWHPWSMKVPSPLQQQQHLPHHMMLVLAAQLPNFSPGHDASLT